ncbi:MAG: GNAT family N-acetyltransferase [Anaerolineaceae bacterium]|nr:GNAT family N-acetyltransferase [Anaerolineaceae bacterium]
MTDATWQPRNSGLVWHKMNESAAKEIASWQYEGNAAFYNTRNEDMEATVVAFCEPAHRYHYVTRSADGRILAFCCFGEDARVLGGKYDENALDVGISIHPRSIGRGWGKQILSLAMEFACCEYQASRFRATIAAFNERALRMCRTAGFQECFYFLQPENRCRYFVLVLDRSKSQFVSHQQGG